MQFHKKDMLMLFHQINSRLVRYVGIGSPENHFHETLCRDWSFFMSYYYFNILPLEYLP